MNKKTILDAQIITVLLLINIVYACFNPADPYAVEVVLNKPGITYDLKPLEKMKNIVKKSENIYLYKSHYDDRLIVTISLQSFSHVNLENLPPKPVAIKSVKTSVDLETLEDAVATAAKNYGWQIVYKTPIFRTGYMVVLEKQFGKYRALLYIIVNGSDRVDIGLTVLGEQKLAFKQAEIIEKDVKSILTTTSLSMATMNIDTDFVLKSFKKKESREKMGVYLAVRVQIPLKIVETQIARLTCNFELENIEPSATNMDAFRNAGWNLIHYDPDMGFIAEKKIGNTLYTASAKKSDRGMFFSLSATNATSVDQAKEVFHELFHTLGLGTEALEKCTFKKEKTTLETKMVPIYDISDEDLAKALASELKWLVDIKVIKGLSERDIDNIASSVKRGYAGWNSRLVWDGEKWVPYHKVPGAYLVKCIGPAPDYYLTFNLTTPPQPEEAPPGGQPAPQENIEAPEQNNIMVFMVILLGVVTALAVAIYFFIRSGK